MNPHCTCPIAGFCSRHQMTKSSRKHALCQGTAKTNDCGLKYWNNWERGNDGATAPAKPLIHDASFCGNGQNDATDGAPAKRSGGGCGSCGGGSKKRRLARRIGNSAVSFASTMLAWAKDGFQFATDDEAAQRREICDACPVKRLLAGKANCSVCNCFIEEKTALRVSSCPVGKWFVERPVRKLDPTRHLLYFVGPVAGNGIWRWNVELLLKQIETFDGVRSIAIATPNKRSERKLDSLGEVRAMFDGVRVDNWLTAPNGGHNKARESLQWRALLETVHGRPGATFFAHTKGVTRERDPEFTICRDWTRASYETCLDDMASVDRALSQYSMAGSFKRYGMFSHTAYKWHYSGTFFWFRNDDVFSRDWSGACFQNRVGVEAWPGRLFPAEETACLYADDCGNPYDGDYWRRHLLPLWDDWRKARP